MISAVLQRRVHIKWGYELIYPNMYVVLVGPSGRSRKGTAMNIGKDILKDIGGISVASESITREALIRKMNDSITSYTDPTTRMIRFHCALTAISPELSVFLGQNDVKFLADLTDWYDSADEWTYETKNVGTDKLQGICFNLLGATAPDWFSSILPQEAVGGGFTSRIIFVVEDKKKQTVADHMPTEEELAMKKLLIKDLEKISTITGQYELTVDAKDRYIAWYEEQDKLMDKGEFPIEDRRFAGYCERRATHVRKLSMAVAASQRQETIVELADMERSMELFKTIEKNMHKTFSGLGSSPYSLATERILAFIEQKREVTRSEVMRQFYRDVDTPTLKLIEDAMEYMKTVRIVRDIENREVIYKYLGKGDSD